MKNNALRHSAKAQSTWHLRKAKQEERQIGAGADPQLKMNQVYNFLLPLLFFNSSIQTPPHASHVRRLGGLFLCHRSHSWSWLGWTCIAQCGPYSGLLSFARQRKPFLSSASEAEGYQQKVGPSASSMNLRKDEVSKCLQYFLPRPSSYSQLLPGDHGDPKADTLGQRSQTATSFNIQKSNAVADYPHSKRNNAGD